MAETSTGGKSGGGGGTGSHKALAAGKEGGSQRSDPRVAVDAFVKIAGQDREYVFRTRDLSKSGLFLYTKVGHVYPFRVGSTLQLELYDYDKSVSCKVVVVRVVQSGSPEADKYPVGFGVRLVDIDDANRAVLQVMLERVRKEGAAY